MEELKHLRNDVGSQLASMENTTLPLLEKQMREVENGIENMLNAIQAGVLTNSTKLRLEKLEAQQKELEIRIAEEKSLGHG